MANEGLEAGGVLRADNPKAKAENKGKIEAEGAKCFT